MNKLPSQEEFEATLAARNETLRNNWIKTMEARIVREELQKCQKAEGVNHYAVCKPLVETYLELLKDAKVSATAKDRAEGHGQSRSYGQKRFRSSKRGHWTRVVLGIVGYTCDEVGKTGLPGLDMVGSYVISNSADHGYFGFTTGQGLQDRRRSVEYVSQLCNTQK
ncbi:hypothetical protein BCV69DRAFT_251616 [Microstroma glucosiphilum]|uniref:NADH-ubiquinone oxidoreductase 12 kDa subunit n=1 Tax=Pseudomicrostroma glucosiphilum TaxID=1684307 RepID=A0A316U3Y0_9BASI|nr:hypothetical protein BCV69DRAFT_251616 [Pseudomicrostroma glucosiphilum]PWN19083.1 hypothetical protein BCV69DRAFT_251616 [Pseudomicrostroma glucosiphilum]